MDLQFVDNYINKKLEENENYIRYTFYELFSQHKISELKIIYQRKKLINFLL